MYILYIFVFYSDTDVVFSLLTNKAPFLGIIFSLILLAGLYQIGKILSKNILIFKVLTCVSEIKYQRITLAINAILLVFFR